MLVATRESIPLGDCDSYHSIAGGEICHMSGGRCRCPRLRVDKVPPSPSGANREVNQTVNSQTDSELMDLFEYQAKELFAKHNVPTTPGRVTDTAEDAKAIAEEIGKPVMVKAQVKVGGRGKAGGVKYAATPDDAFTHAQQHPRPGHQGPRRQEAAGRRGQRHRRGVLHLLPARPLQPHLPGHVLGRGRHGDRRGRRRPSPSGSPRCPSTPSRVSTWRSPARSPSRATCPPRCSTPPR